MTKTTKGLVYALTNPAMPDLVKIGETEGNDTNALKKRMKQLYATSVPYPFEWVYAVVVDNRHNAEKLLHEAFRNARKNSHREFFRIAPESVVAAMKLTGGKVVCVDDFADSDMREDIGAGERERERINKIRSNFKFSDARIPGGAELTFSRDENITAKAHGEKKVRFDGKVMSLSRAARLAFKKAGEPISWKSVAGTLYWQYDGETLDEIRIRLDVEREQEEQEDE